MLKLPDIKKIKVETEQLENGLTREKKNSLSILRLDKIHPDISGNKFFKLYYFLEDALHSTHKKIITFGGAYSNHLAAAAKASRLLNIKSVGIVRGERPSQLSHTLLFCKEQGMDLEFISREKYKEKTEKVFLQYLKNKYGEHILVPEGGFDDKGVNGAALISVFDEKKYSHICCAVGTATTLAGLIKSSKVGQQIIGFSVLKNFTDQKERMQFLNISKSNYSVITDYSFGGYAKKNSKLILFMNNFYAEFGIPTDFVYTAKMMFGVFDLIKKNYFPQNSNILCIHTGGLKGNISLPPKTLNF